MNDEKDSPRELDTEPPMLLPPDLESIAANEPKQSTIVEGEKKLSENHSENVKIDIDGFEIVRELGRGGMGAVFLAIESSLHRQVALKIVTQSLLGSSGLRERFDAEVRALASLQHPNIAQLFSAGINNGEPYFVMEYVDGSTLDDHAREPLKDAEAAKLVAELSSAVEYCHEQGVIHRDLKPSNILMSSKGSPKVADFGLAKALDQDDTSTRTGEILGTPGYMSPEQAGGVVKSIGPGCDVYGLGAILYRLLTGRAPFVSQEPFQTVVQVLSEDPIRPRTLNPSVSKDLETICLKCLEKSPGKRYASAQDLQDDLQRYLDGKPILARPNNWVQRSSKWMRRNPAIAVGILATLVVLTGSLIGLGLHNSVLAVELNRSNELSKSLAKELERSNRLANSGSDLGYWITSEFLNDLYEISGTTSERNELQEKLSAYLENSFQDMPDDPKFTVRLADSYMGLANTQGSGETSTTGEIDKAEQNMNRSIELYEEALKTEPNEKTLRSKLDALMALQDIHEKKGRMEKRIQIMDSIEPLVDSLSEDVADTSFLKIQYLGRRIEICIETQEYEKGIKLLDDLDAEVDRLASYSNEKRMEDVVNQRVFVASNRGKCYEGLGQLEDAEKSIRDSVKLAEEALAKESKKMLPQIRLSIALVQLADNLSAQTKLEDALTYYKQASDIASTIASQNPDNIDAQVDAARKWSRLSSQHQLLGNLDEALSILKKSMAHLESLEKKGLRSFDIESGIIFHTRDLGHLLVSRGDFAESKTVYAKHKSLCEQYIQNHQKDIFVVEQLAENNLRQALGILMRWIKEGVDPATIKTSDDYKDIQKFLKDGKDYYRQLGELVNLDPRQISQHSQLEQLGPVVEQIIEEATNSKKQDDF